jgi:hypothetical protein
MQNPMVVLLCYGTVFHVLLQSRRSYVVQRRLVTSRDGTRGRRPLLLPCRRATQRFGDDYTRHRSPYSLWASRSHRRMSRDGNLPCRRLSKRYLTQALAKAKKGNAKGPDGIPTVLWRLARAATVEDMYALFAACGRFGWSPDEWNASIWFPVYEGNVDPAEPVNNIPLRFLSSIHIMYLAAVEVTVASEVHNHWQQFALNAGRCRLDRC